MTEYEDRWGFDKWAESYDESVGDRNWIHGCYDNVINDIAEVIINYSGGRDIKLLDIGAGTGNLLLKLSEYKNIEKFAIEPSKGMREKLLEKCGDVTVLEGSLPVLPETDKKFDVIVSSYVIHHIEHHQTIEMLKSINKYASDKCLILFADVMFESEKVYKNHIDELNSKNMTDMVEELEDEFFQFIDILKRGMENLGYKSRCRRYDYYVHVLFAEK